MKKIISPKIIIILLILFSPIIIMSLKHERTIFFYKNSKYTIRISSNQVYESTNIKGIKITKYLNNEKTSSVWFSYSLGKLNSASHSFNNRFFYNKQYYLNDCEIKSVPNYY